MRKSLIVAGVLLLSPVVSQAKTLEELLVEKGVITKGEAKSAMNSAPAKIYWNKGTRIEFPDSGFTAGFTTFLQERYTFTDTDEDVGGKNTSSFDVQKARIILSGSALHNEFTYYLQSDFVGESNGDGEKTTSLKDAWVNWNACDWGSVKMGQYKTFVSRQFNNSDYALQFPDRSIASDQFDLGRQAGASGMMQSDDGTLSVRAGIFNGLSDGEGINRSGIDTKHTGVAEVRWVPMGEIDSYVEGDVDHTEDMAVSMGAAYGYSDAELSDLGTTSLHNISADANLKYQGFALHGEFFWQRIDPDDSDENVEPLGGYVQAGYFLTPKKLELAGRYSMVDCDAQSDSTLVAGGVCGGNDKVNEAAVTLNYYWWKHHLKASLAYFLINEDLVNSESEDINTNKWMIQLSQHF